MAQKFKVELVTPKGVVLNKEVEEVIAPGIMGEFGVLVGHTPMLTFIKPGVFSYLENDRFVRYAVGSGFCEVLKDAVNVLVVEAHSVDQLDKNEANEELVRLEREILEVSAVDNPSEYEKLSESIKVAKAKVSILS
jgi:F-type H+-transporting ATPase subunit epsilon